MKEKKMQIKFNYNESSIRHYRFPRIMKFQRLLSPNNTENSMNQIQEVSYKTTILDEEKKVVISPSL